jgi:hypothetical protein
VKQRGTRAHGSASAIPRSGECLGGLPIGFLWTQSHYINTSLEPRVSKDTITIHTTSRDLSELTILHLFVSSQIDFEIPAGTQDYSARAGCTLDRDLSFLSLAPHMHEWGNRIDFSLGQTGAMKPVLSVTGWDAAMRDLPPVTSFDTKEAGSFKTGDSVELQCTWSNTETHSISFPNEMCAVVGYFTSEASGDVMCLDTLH